MFSLSILALFLCTIGTIFAIPTPRLSAKDLNKYTQVLSPSGRHPLV